MGAKTDALATQIEGKAREAIATIQKLGDADWKKVTAAEKWTVGVTAHHLAGGLEAVAGIVSGLVAGAPPRGNFTRAMLDQMNAQHARDHADCTRAETLALREREFVTAGRALGMSHLRIIFRQIAPNLVSTIVVIATLQVAQVIILESFLSFLGLGVQPPTPAWGNMLGEGRVYMLNSWWIATFPGLAIFLTTLVINLMGNALRDWLDPHLKL